MFGEGKTSHRDFEYGKQISKFRQRDRQRESKEMEELSAFFTHAANPGQVPVSERNTGVPPGGTQHPRPAERNPRKDEVISKGQHRGSRPAKQVQAAVVTRERQSCHSSVSKSSITPTCYTWSTSDQNEVSCGDARNAGLSRSETSTPRSVRRAILESGVFGGMRRANAEASGTHRVKGSIHHADAEARAGALENDIDSRNRQCFVRPARYQDQGVMTESDHAAELANSAQKMTESQPTKKADDTRPLEQSSAGVKLTAASETCGREDDDAIKERSTRAELAEKAYMNRTMNHPEPPPRPASTKTNMLRHLEAQADALAEAQASFVTSASGTASPLFGLEGYSTQSMSTSLDRQARSSGPLGTILPPRVRAEGGHTGSFAHLPAWAAADSNTVDEMDPRISMADYINKIEFEGLASYDDEAIADAHAGGFEDSEFLETGCQPIDPHAGWDMDPVYSRQPEVCVWPPSPEGKEAEADVVHDRRHPSGLETNILDYPRTRNTTLQGEPVPNGQEDGCLTMAQFWRPNHYCM